MSVLNQNLPFKKEEEEEEEAAATVTITKKSRLKSHLKILQAKIESSNKYPGHFT